MIEMPLNNLTILLSDADLDCCFISWHINAGYARNKTIGYLHLLIAKRLNLIGEIDHKDRNKLNCQRENLRKATSQQNKANRNKLINCLSIYKGVTFCKRKNLWRAQIGINNTNYNLGYFKDEIEAAKEYNRVALKAFGEFAVLNEV